MIERVMDFVATKLGLDPVQVRLKKTCLSLNNGVPVQDHETGLLYDSGNYQAALEKAQELAEWPELLQEQRRGAEGGPAHSGSVFLPI